MTRFAIAASEEPSDGFEHFTNLHAHDAREALYTAGMRWQLRAVEEGGMSPPIRTRIDFVRLPIGAPGEWFLRIEWHDSQMADALRDVTYLRAVVA